MSGLARQAVDVPCNVIGHRAAWPHTHVTVTPCECKPKVGASVTDDTTVTVPPELSCARSAGDKVSEWSCVALPMMLYVMAVVDVRSAVGTVSRWPWLPVIWLPDDPHADAGSGLPLVPSLVPPPNKAMNAVPPPPPQA